MPTSLAMLAKLIAHPWACDANTPRLLEPTAVNTPRSFGNPARIPVLGNRESLLSIGGLPITRPYGDPGVTAVQDPHLGTGGAIIVMNVNGVNLRDK